MADSSNQAARILVVDRDNEVGLQIRDSLRHEGFHCDHFSTAAGALTYTRQELPSLMIVDTDLDACCGFDFARTVHDEYPRHEIPVIFVSQARSNELLEASRHAGGIYFLSKPIDLSVLLELVDKALWMPHLIRRHIDTVAHASSPRAPRVLSERVAARAKLTP